MAGKKKKDVSTPRASHKLILRELENLLPPHQPPPDDWEARAEIPVRVLTGMDTIPRDDMPMVFARLRAICEKSPVPLPLIASATEALHSRH